MPGLIERRKEYLELIRRFTLEQGYFTVSDIAEEAGVPGPPPRTGSPA